MKYRKAIVNGMKLSLVIMILLTPIFVVSTQAAPSLSKITTSKGKSFDATPANIQVALNSLNGAGDVWLPPKTFSLTASIKIPYSGVKLHGYMSATYGYTVLNFNNKGKITASNKDNIFLDSFKIEGGIIEIILGDNTYLKNIQIQYALQGNSGAFRFIVPAGTVYNLNVESCSTYKTYSHGFVINSYAPYKSCKIDGVNFKYLEARWAGWNYAGKSHGNYSTGINIAENYCGSILTVRNANIYKCKAEYCWESGFHMELKPTKYNVVYTECTAQYNGQKKKAGINTGGIGVTYCAGFLISTSGVKLVKCISNYNTGWGYRGTLQPILVSCTGKGNGLPLYTTGCVLK